MNPELATAQPEGADDQVDYASMLTWAWLRNLIGFLHFISLIVVRFGMPIATFGLAAWLLLLAFAADGVNPDLKVGVGGGLVVTGIVAYLWLYARANPLRERDSASWRQLLSLVDRLVEDRRLK